MNIVGFIKIRSQNCRCVLYRNFSWVLSNQICHCTCCITPKRVTSWRGPSPRQFNFRQHGLIGINVAAVASRWQHCVQLQLRGQPQTSSSVDERVTVQPNGLCSLNVVSKLIFQKNLYWSVFSFSLALYGLLLIDYCWKDNLCHQISVWRHSNGRSARIWGRIWCTSRIRMDKWSHYDVSRSLRW